MGRKNNRASGKVQANRDRFGNAGKPRPPRVPLEDMVLPSGTCPSRKLRFATEADAAKALRQAQQQRTYLRSGAVEQRYYGGPNDPCLRGCGGWHLTSRKEWSKRP